MLRHVAVFTFTPEASNEQVAALADGLARLPAQIPDIRDYRFGPDAGLSDNTDDFAVVADFDDLEGYRRYASHPAHQDLLATLLRPILAGRHSVQFAVNE